MGCDGKTRSAAGASPAVAPTENRGHHEPPRKHFKADDWSLVLDWLEIPGNLEDLEGSEGRTQIGHKAPTKMKSFQAMAIFINDRQSRASNLKTLDGPGARNRFMYIHSKYKKTKIDLNITGFGLTAADEKAGITTIEQKLHVACPSYGRLDVIFGDSPAVNVRQNLFNSGLSANNVDTVPSHSAGSTFILSDGEDDVATEHVIPDNIPTQEQADYVPPFMNDPEFPNDVPIADKRPPLTPQSCPAEAPGAKLKRQKKNFDRGQSALNEWCFCCHPRFIR